jgi:hypothetical protein
VGWWVWLFLAFFAVLVWSRIYFALHARPPEAFLDRERSVLVARDAESTEARIVVRHVPRGGQVRLRVDGPVAGGPWRVLVQWDPGLEVPGEGDERTLVAVLPRVQEVEVVDQRGPVHEVMRLHLAPGAR